MTVVRRESIFDLLRADDNENRRTLFAAAPAGLCSLSTDCGAV